MKTVAAVTLIAFTGACTQRCPTPPPVPPGATTIAELPALDQPMRGIGAPVDLVVDRYGWPHVVASSLRDAAFAEGLAMARDRMPQMELFRRSASGTLAEVFGLVSAKLMEADITMRTLGLRRAAQMLWDQLPPGRERELFLGFSDGVTEHIRQVRSGAACAPRGSELLLTSRTADWTPVDSLAVLRLMELFLSYNADEEINRTLLRDRARAVFDEADPLSAPDAAARRGFFSDVERFEPPSSAAIVPSFYAAAERPRRHRTARTAVAAVAGPSSRRKPLPAHLFGALASLRRVLPEASRVGVGTNTWAVDPSHTASGHALLANDPHLPLISPSILWGVHLKVTSGPDAMDVFGTAFPGVPGVVFGANNKVAWGIANGMFDMMDVYEETVTAGVNGAPDTVSFQGRQVPIETRIEKVPNGIFGTLDVKIETVPHHGPILPTFASEGILARRTGARALSVRWLGAEATHEVRALTDLLYASDTATAQAAVRGADAPGMGFIFADTAGAVAYRATGRVPIRAPGALTFDPVTAPNGTMPATVLPGTGEAEWVGYLDPDSLPVATAGPMRPWIVASNNDVAGLSADGNPFNKKVYLGYGWSPGFRAERIAQRLGALGSGATVEDMQSIQSDHVVLMARRFQPFLLSALARLDDEWAHPGTHPDLRAVAAELLGQSALTADVAARLAEWSFDSPSGLEEGAPDRTRRDAVATTLFHAWLVRIVDLALSDEIATLGAPSSSGASPKLDPGRGMIALLFLLEHPDRARTRDAQTGQSAIWDDLRTPSERETRDAILLRALGVATRDLARLTGNADRNAWTWGTLHTVRFASVLPHFSLSLGADLSIPPPGDAQDPNGYARPGGIDTVDQAWPELQDADGHPAPVFSYTRGPARRITIEMTPAGPRAFDALPGGQSSDLRSPHFSDEARLWRANRTHPLLLTEPDIAANAEARWHLLPHTP